MQAFVPKYIESYNNQRIERGMQLFNISLISSGIINKATNWVSTKKMGSVYEVQSNTGYHVTKTEYVDSIYENGFRESTSGRAGGGGVYVNNTPEGALAEFSKYNPSGTPNTMITVKYNSGLNVMIENPGSHIIGPLPILGDTLTFESMQLPGTFNTIIRNGSIVILK